MNLVEQIAQLSNPQEFTGLCNMLLTAKYDKDFQVIDGTRSDEGNDGYIISEKRVFAIYCPVKPEQKTDKGYLAKIRSDLKKAFELHKSGKYEVENWTFLTPRKLSSTVIAEMRKEARLLNINANHQESTYLASILYEKKHLIKEFPFLHVLEIDDKLEELRKFLKVTPEKALTQATAIDENHVYKPDTKNNEEFDRVIEIRKKTRTEETLCDLRKIYYMSTDPDVRLNALLGILDLYDPVEDSAEKMISLCDDGIQIANEINNEPVKAYFLARKGYFLSYIYSDIDLRTALQIRVDNVIGFSTITEEQRLHIIKKLERLEEDYVQAFSKALDLTLGGSDFVILASVLIAIGNAATHRALYLNALGIKERAENENQLGKRALLTAKDLYARLKDELGISNALLNFANHIRFFGENKEALKLTDEVIKVAEKFDDKLLLQKARWLKKTLETGKIPDYIHGERRD